MDIWLVSIFEQTPLDNTYSWRYMGIAEAAVRCGHKVTFVASTFRHTSKKQRYQETTRVNVKENYDMLYIKSMGYSKNVSFKRLYSHYDYSKNLIRAINKIEKKPDVILMAYPPISTAAALTKWGKDNDIPVIIDIIDSWPDIFDNNKKGVAGKAFSLAINLLKKKVKKIFDNATAVTSISNDYVQWAASYNSKHKDCPCFYPAYDFEGVKNDIARVSGSLQLDPGEFRVIYAGSLAISYDMPTILGAARILEKKFGDKIKFIIAGKGVQDVVVKEAASNSVNVEYLGWLEKEQLLKEYCKASLGLAQYSKGSRQTVTYKLFDLLSFNLPILNSLVGEMNDIILENKVGLFNASGDEQKLADNIELLYTDRSLFNELKSNCHPVTARLGDSKVVYKKMISYLEAVAKKSLSHSNNLL